MAGGISVCEGVTDWTGHDPEQPNLTHWQTNVGLALPGILSNLNDFVILSGLGSRVFRVGFTVPKGKKYNRYYLHVWQQMVFICATS